MQNGFDDKHQQRRLYGQYLIDILDCYFYTRTHKKEVLIKRIHRLNLFCDYDRTQELRCRRSIG